MKFPVRGETKKGQAGVFVAPGGRRREDAEGRLRARPNT